LFSMCTTRVPLRNSGDVNLVWSTAGTAFTVDESVERFEKGTMKVRDLEVSLPSCTFVPFSMLNRQFMPSKT
jgi:hypothetical protein